MQKEKQQEFKSRLWIIDDQAKPLVGSAGQYTRLILLGLRSAKGLNNRHFVVFAESDKLFNHVHDKLNTADWIREGFEKKWIYIEEVLHKPSAAEDIHGYLQIIKDTDLWIGIFEFITELGVLESTKSKIVGSTYGLPREDLKQPGLPPGIFKRK